MIGRQKVFFLFFYGVMTASIGLAFDSTTDKVDVENIADAWFTAEKETHSIDARWHYPKRTGIEQYSKFQTYWAAATEAERNRRDDFQYRLLLDGNRFRFSSQRWAVGTHRLDVPSNKLEERYVPQYSPYTQKYAEIGYRSQFSTNLYHRFTDPYAEFADPQPFTRIFDGDRAIDKWEATTVSHARVIVRNPSTQGSVAWVRLVPELDWSDQVDSLNLNAALLAFRQFGSSYLNIRPDRFRVRAGSQTIDGRPCIVVDEIANDDQENYRTFWIDANAEFVVRRFVGTVKVSHRQSEAQAIGAMPSQLANSQVNIQYKQNDDSSWSPISWTVMAFAGQQFPLAAFSRAVISDVSPLSEALKNSAFAVDADIVGAWVIDETTGVQYIVRSKDSVRVIEKDELALRPLYDDLAQTESGELLTREWESPVLQNLRRLLLVVGIVILSLAATRYLRKR